MKVLVLTKKDSNICTFGIFHISEQGPMQAGSIQVGPTLMGQACTDVLLMSNWKTSAHLAGHKILDGATPLSQCDPATKEALRPWTHVDDNLQETQN